jgi:hypothetical protein
MCPAITDHVKHATDEWWISQILNCNYILQGASLMHISLENHSPMLRKPRHPQDKLKRRHTRCHHVHFLTIMPSPRSMAKLVSITAIIFLNICISLLDLFAFGRWQRFPRGKLLAEGLVSLNLHYPSDVGVIPRESPAPL